MDFLRKIRLKKFVFCSLVTVMNVPIGQGDSKISTKCRSKVILTVQSLQIQCIIIQQIVTLSKYGHDALDICHP